MSYEGFRNRVNAILSRMNGDKPTVQFNADNGRYYANFSDGTVIVGNSVSKKIAVRWDGRMAYANV